MKSKDSSSARALVEKYSARIDGSTSQALR
jgi:hypothetical protein